MTWALHIALLDAMRHLGLSSPDIDHLLDVDNLYVQEVIPSMGMEDEPKR